MEINLSKLGTGVLSMSLLIAGAGLGVMLYNGMMPEDIPARMPAAVSRGSETNLHEIFRNTAWLKPLAMFIVMLAGMFCNQIFENLKVQKEAGKTTVNIFRMIAQGSSGITFWMAFFVSPLIFYGTYYLVDGIPDGAVGYFYSFQGGFFWYNIFSRFEAKNKK